MNKILIVSDNARLVKFFQDECSAQELDKLYNIIYKYSAKNKNPNDLIGLGMSPVDMRSEEEIDELLIGYNLIISLHCKQIFPERVVKSITCINVHPGFNPYNRGWYPQVFSIINKKPVGATIHKMDVEIDSGDIIDQIEVNVSESDTSLSVYDKVYEAEKTLLKKNIANIFCGRFKSSLPADDGNYNGIDDFKDLCKLNLDSMGTLKDHIDLLRALSHGGFKNSYFVDDKTGEKIYISVNLTRE